MTMIITNEILNAVIHCHYNGLQKYLILLSIHETCKYRGINFFDFLKSGELNISEYEKKSNRKK